MYAGGVGRAEQQDRPQGSDTTGKDDIPRKPGATPDARTDAWPGDADGHRADGPRRVPRMG